MIRRISLVIALAVILAGCGNSTDNVFQGWVEADLIFVSPDENGRVETLSVREGDAVTQDAPLFTIDPDLQQADVSLAQASVTDAEHAYERAQALLKTAAGTQRALDDAEAALRTAGAQLNSAQTRLTRRRKFSVRSRAACQRFIIAPAKWCRRAGRCVRFCRPGNIKVRFFVPEAELPKISLGENVTIKCDGCRADVAARVTFISRSSEFTPPVIYGQEERSKLVFMIEARTTRRKRCGSASRSP